MSRDARAAAAGGVVRDAVARAAGAAARDAGAALSVARDAGAAARREPEGGPGAGAAGAGAAARWEPEGGAGSRRFAITFDGTRCVKCWACEVACRQWSGLEAAAPARRWVREEVRGTFPQVNRDFVSEGCRHCADAPCVAACAFGALEQRADGRVTVDASACTGCGRCAHACPHDVPRFVAGVMDKCDGCFAAGVAPGAVPHCVATCPTGALGFEAAFAPSAPAGSDLPAAGASGSFARCAGGDAAAVQGDAPAAPAAVGEGRATSSRDAAAFASVAAGASMPCDGRDPAQLADAYGLLSSLVIREAPAALLAALRDDPQAAPAPLVSYAHSLREADLDREAESLAVDFATVLLGMSPHPVFPYESAYADGDRLLIRPVRDDVVRAYAAAGFAVDPALGLPEDHLAFELAFAAHLARRESDARAAGDAAAAAEDAARRLAFERDHLRSWVPRFAADWKRASASPFYRALAGLLADLEGEGIGWA